MDYHDLLDRFLISKEAGGLAARTLRSYFDNIMLHFRYCEARGLPPLDPNSVESFLASQRRNGMSPNTVGVRYRSLSVFSGWLAGRKLSDDFMAPVARPITPSKIAPYVTRDEFDTLVSFPAVTWLDARDRLMLMFLFYSGLRVSELVGLVPQDLNAANAFVVVRDTKNHHDRTVPCPEATKTAFIAYMYARPASPYTALFLSNDGFGGVRGALQTGGVRQMLKRRCEDAGLRYMNPHLFRHGFAMWLLNNGVQKSAVGEMLGHRDAASTDIYARWLPTSVQHEYNLALNRLSGGK